MPKLATNARLFNRLEKEKKRLAEATLRGRVACRPAEPPGALRRLQVATRVYRQQLETLVMLDKYAGTGAVISDNTRSRHAVKRAFKRLRLETACISAERVLGSDTYIGQQLLKVFDREAAALRVALVEARALLGHEAKTELENAALQDAVCTARAIAKGQIRKAWTRAEDEALLNGARTLPHRSISAINTRRSKLRAPAREDDRRRLRALAHAQADRVISANAVSLRA